MCEIAGRVSIIVLPLASPTKAVKAKYNFITEIHTKQTTAQRILNTNIFQ